MKVTSSHQMTDCLRMWAHVAFAACAVILLQHVACLESGKCACCMMWEVQLQSTCGTQPSSTILAALCRGRPLLRCHLGSEGASRLLAEHRRLGFGFALWRCLRLALRRCLRLALWRCLRFALWPTARQSFGKLHGRLLNILFPHLLHPLVLPPPLPLHPDASAAALFGTPRACFNEH